MEQEEHEYTAETKIRFHCSSGYVGSERSEITTIGECLGSDDEEIQGMTRTAVESSIEDACREWMFNWIDFGWGTVKDEE